MRCLALIGSFLLAAVFWAPPTDGLAGDTASSVAGVQVYRTYCAVCHGDRGQGDGPLAGGLRSAPSDLTVLARENGGEYPTEMVTKIVDGRDPVAGHGGGDMPVWGDAFGNAETDDEKVVMKIQAVVEYVGRLQKK